MYVFFCITDALFQPRGHNESYIADLCRHYLFICGENVTIDCPDPEVGVWPCLWHFCLKGSYLAYNAHCLCYWNGLGLHVEIGRNQYYKQYIQGFCAHRICNIHVLERIAVMYAGFVWCVSFYCGSLLQVWKANWVIITQELLPLWMHRFLILSHNVFP